MLHTKGAGSGVSQAELDALQTEITAKNLQIEELKKRPDLFNTIKNAGLYAEFDLNSRGTFTDYTYTPKTLNWIGKNFYGKALVAVALECLYGSSTNTANMEFYAHADDAEPLCETGFLNMGSYTASQATECRIYGIEVPYFGKTSFAIGAYNNNKNAFNGTVYTKAKLFALKA